MSAYYLNDSSLFVFPVIFRNCRTFTGNFLFAQFMTNRVCSIFISKSILTIVYFFVVLMINFPCILLNNLLFYFRIQLAFTQSEPRFHHFNFLPRRIIYANSKAANPTTDYIEFNCRIGQSKCTYEWSHCCSNPNLFCNDVVIQCISGHLLGIDNSSGKCRFA